jgi:hypothetical protein
MNAWDNQYPEATEYSHFYGTYVQEVPRTNIIEYLNAQMHEFYTFINSIPGDKLFEVYEEGKWSIKQIIGHIIETERIFSYRALRLSRGDNTPLPGFDQDHYVAASNYEERSMANLANEYLAVRIATVHLLQNMTGEMVQKSGNASNADFTVRAIAYIIAGHQQHHYNIIREKYLG